MKKRHFCEIVGERSKCNADNPIVGKSRTQCGHSFSCILANDHYAFCDETVFHPGPDRIEKSNSKRRRGRKSVPRSRQLVCLIAEVVESHFYNERAKDSFQHPQYCSMTALKRPSEMRFAIETNVRAPGPPR